MTIKKLIDKLSKQPQDLRVLIESGDCNLQDIDEINAISVVLSTSNTGYGHQEVCYLEGGCDKKVKEKDKVKALLIF